MSDRLKILQFRSTLLFYFILLTLCQYASFDLSIDHLIFNGFLVKSSKLINEKV